MPVLLAPADFVSTKEFVESRYFIPDSSSFVSLLEPWSNILVNPFINVPFRTGVAVDQLTLQNPQIIKGQYTSFRIQLWAYVRYPNAGSFGGNANMLYDVKGWRFTAAAPILVDGTNRTLSGMNDIEILIGSQNINQISIDSLSIYGCLPAQEYAPIGNPLILPTTLFRSDFTALPDFLVVPVMYIRTYR
jgi:hypothetical protein